MSLKKSISSLMSFGRKTKKLPKIPLGMTAYKMRNYDIGYRFLPKTASTSIKRFLYHIDEGVPYCPSEHVSSKKQTSGGEKRVHAWVRKNRVTNIHHCKWRFIVIRDPIERCISAYNNRVLTRRSLDRDRLQKNNPIVAKIVPHYSPSFDEFFENFKAYYRVPDIKHHTRPVSSWLDGFDLSHFTDIVLFHKIDEMASKICQITGKNVQMPFEQRSPSHTKHNLNELSSRHLDFLLDFYEDDYKLMDSYYSADKIRTKWLNAQKL